MQTIYSAEFMQDNCGCYKKEKGKLELMVLKGRKEITYLDILNSDIPLKDKYWFFCEKIFTKEQNKQIAIAVAEIVLPIYEEKYPNSKVPREAIEAAKLYAKKEITLGQLMIKRRAAASAASDYAVSASSATIAAASYAAAAASYAAAAAVSASSATIAAASYAAAAAVSASSATIAPASYAAAAASYAAAAAVSASSATIAAASYAAAAAVSASSATIAAAYAVYYAGDVDDSYIQKLEKALTNFIESN